jgi:arylsulfatase A-like enzyme
MPTLLALMGLPIPDTVEGVNLSHCARGEYGPEPEAALMECTGATAAWKDGHEWRALRSKQYTYARYRVGGQEFLFDNLDDPYQTHNLINNDGNKDVIEYFRGLLKERMKELNDGFEKCTWYRNRWTENRIILRSAKGDFPQNSKI